MCDIKEPDSVSVSSDLTYKTPQIGETEKSRETPPPREPEESMYSRSDSVTMTVHHERFAFTELAPRSTEPEVFTFERIPAAATAVRSYVPIRPKKRCTRVMYPAKVRMHLPPPEKSQAKRWLMVLCLVVLWQIYTEEPCAEAQLSGPDASIGDFHGFRRFQSAEEQARQLTRDAASESGCEGASDDHQTVPITACSRPGQEGEESSLTFEQNAGKSCMVALLVYHKLGSEN